MTVLSDIPLKTIRGADASLADYAGKVLLVVNVASHFPTHVGKTHAPRTSPQLPLG